MELFRVVYNSTGATILVIIPFISWPGGVVIFHNLVGVLIGRPGRYTASKNSTVVPSSTFEGTPIMPASRAAA